MMKSKMPPSRDRHKSGHLSKEDLHLWQQVKRTVKPLYDSQDDLAANIDFENGKASGDAARKPSGPNIDGIEPSQSERPGRAFPTAPYTPPVSRPAAKTGMIDDKTARKLLKGRLSIEDRIDLHGMTQDQAHRLLNAFLARSHASGMRMVLVITGKGRTGSGVLREVVPHWLREPCLSNYVSAFRSAHITHGGEGALYVRLRRRDNRGEGR